MEFLKVIFWGLVVEAIVAFIAWRFEKKLQVFVALSLVALAVGIIAFGPWTNSDSDPDYNVEPDLKLSTTTDNTDRTPWLVEPGNPAVTINTSDNGNGSGEGLVRFQMHVAGEPLHGAPFFITRAIEKPDGDWQLPLPDEPEFFTDKDGSIELILPEGMYAITGGGKYLLYDSTCGKSGANWGVQLKIPQDSDGIGGAPPLMIEMLPFPVFDGRMTEIELDLGMLEVALFDHDGKAMKSETVRVYQQGVDVAGDAFADLEKLHRVCGSGTTGLVSIAVGAGEYVVEIGNFYPDRLMLYDVVVEPGELTRFEYTVEISVTSQP